MTCDLCGEPGEIGLVVNDSPFDVALTLCKDCYSKAYALRKKDLIKNLKSLAGV